MRPLARAARVDQQHRFIRQHLSQFGCDLDGVKALLGLLGALFFDGLSKLRPAPPSLA